ncbi:MAG: hypothetical protein AAGU74_08380 [Bacillota bacterium]
MKKYRVELGAFVTRICVRRVTVSANNEEEACQKAEEKYYALEKKLVTSGDIGRINFDFVEELP